MGTEIERKFLVTSLDFVKKSNLRSRIRQGYLNLEPDRTVRIRMMDETNAWLCVKGRNEGHTRQEFEYRIPERDGFDMLQMCKDGYIDKVRYYVPCDNDLIIEVDIFGGDNIGLIVAEIEFDENDPRKDVHQEMANFLPDWIGTEVTNDAGYYNSALLNYPFTKWESP